MQIRQLMTATLTLTILLLGVHISPGKACTVFSVESGGNSYFCSNEDSDESGAKIWVKPGSANTHSALFWGFSNGYVQGGINEKGVAWDWWAGFESGRWKRDPKKLNYDGQLSEKIMQEAATVDEVVGFYQRYNEPDFDGARMLVSDRRGASAIIGWDNGGLLAERKNGRYQVMGLGEEAVTPHLKQANGIDSRKLAALLDASHEEGNFSTRYSTIYDSSKALLHVYYRHNFAERVTLDVRRELAKGAHEYRLSRLFSSLKILSPLQKAKIAPSEATLIWSGSEKSAYRVLYSTKPDFSSAVSAIPQTAQRTNTAKISLAMLLPGFVAAAGAGRRRKKLLIISLLLLAACLLTNCADVTGSSHEPVKTGQFSTTLTKLSPDTTYYWKVVATPSGYSGITSESATYTFHTSAK